MACAGETSVCEHWVRERAREGLPESMCAQAVHALFLSLDVLPLSVETEAVTAVPEYGHSVLQRSSWDPANAVLPAAFVWYVCAAVCRQAQGCSPSQPDAMKSCEVILSKYNRPLSSTYSLRLGTMLFPVQSWLAFGQRGYGQSLSAKRAVMSKSDRAGRNLNLKFS